MADFDGTIDNSESKLTFDEIKAEVGHPGPYFIMKAVRLLKDNPQEEPALLISPGYLNIWWVLWYMAWSGKDIPATLEVVHQRMIAKCEDPETLPTTAAVYRHWIGRKEELQRLLMESFKKPAKVVTESAVVINVVQVKNTTKH